MKFLLLALFVTVVHGSWGKCNAKKSVHRWCKQKGAGWYYRQLNWLWAHCCRCPAGTYQPLAVSPGGFWGCKKCPGAKEGAKVCPSATTSPTGPPTKKPSTTPTGYPTKKPSTTPTGYPTKKPRTCSYKMILGGRPSGPCRDSRRRWPSACFKNGISLSACQQACSADPNCIAVEYNPQDGKMCAYDVVGTSCGDSSFAFRRGNGATQVVTVDYRARYRPNYYKWSCYRAHCGGPKPPCAKSNRWCRSWYCRYSWACRYCASKCASSCYCTAFDLEDDLEDDVSSVSADDFVDQFIA